MTVNYPASLDDNTSLKQPQGSLSGGTDKLSTAGVIHGTVHQNEIQAIIALETKLGIDASAVTSTIDYLLKSTSSINPGHKHTAASITGFIATDGSVPTTASVPFAFGLTAGSANDFAVSNSGVITKYFGVPTVSMGVPAELATIDLTGQTAAIGDTTLFTPAGNVMVRISVILRVSTPGTVSSILGGTTGVVIKYTEPNDSTSMIAVMGLFDQGGKAVTVSSGNTNNTNKSFSQGTLIIYAKAGSVITYAVGYGGGGGVTAMQYAVHLKAEVM